MLSARLVADEGEAETNNVPVEIKSSYRYHIDGTRVAKNVEVTNRDTGGLFDKRRDYLVDSQKQTAWLQIML